MKLLANPILARMVLLFVIAAALFVLGVWLMRRLRRELAADAGAPTPRADNAPAFAMAALQSLIQQLKDKQQDLERLRQAAQERAAASENIAAAVLTNLDSGVLVFNRAGLVQQANPAARQILGYSTVSGMRARDLFRGVAAMRGRDGNAPPAVEEALERCLRDAAVFRGLEADYATPSGTRWTLAITIAPALGEGGEGCGAVCLVSVRS